MAGTGWEFVSPALLILGVFVVIPTIWGIALSFTQYDGIAPAHFTGIHNYDRAIHDPLIWKALLNTGIYVLMTLPLGLMLGLGIALALHQKWFVARSFVRGVYFHHDERRPAGPYTRVPLLYLADGVPESRNGLRLRDGGDPVSHHLAPHPGAMAILSAEAAAVAIGIADWGLEIADWTTKSRNRGGPN
jgi:hypothetical protein